MGAIKREEKEEKAALGEGEDGSNVAATKEGSAEPFRALELGWLLRVV